MIRLKGTNRILANPLGIEGLQVHSNENGIVDFSMEQTAANIHLANDYGIDCPSLMPDKYDFFRLARKFNLIPYPDQIKGAISLTKFRRGGLFTEMSGGKTLTTLMALDYQLQIGTYKKVLIICPSANINDPWKAHLTTYYPHLYFRVLANKTRTKREKILEDVDPITLVNIEVVKNDVDILSECGFDLIIIDEFSWLKNTTSLRYKAVKKLLTPSTHLWPLTASPVSNSPIDAYALITLMGNVDMFGRHVPYMDPEVYNEGKPFMNKSYWTDLTTVRIPIRNYSGKGPRFILKPKKEAKEITSIYLHPFYYGKVDREKEKRKTLTLHNPLRLKPTAQQLLLMEQIKNNSINEYDGLDIMTKARVTMQKISQVASGILIGQQQTDEYDPDLGFKLEHNYTSFPTPAKTGKMLEIIRNSPSKVIVLSSFIGVVENIKQELIRNNIGCIALQEGGPAQSDLKINKFKKDKTLKVLVTNPRRISHGKNIQQASTIIWFDPPMYPEIFVQVNGRIDRPGQEYDMNIYELAVCSQEVSQYKSLHSKKEFDNALKDMYLSFIKD